MKSPQIKWIDSIAMSCFSLFMFIASMESFGNDKPAAALIWLGVSVVCGIVAVKNFRKKV